jgi:hypothetical protein
MSRRQRHLNPAHTGATLALDSRFISGIANGGTVASWTDRSANANHATQSSETLKPAFQTGGQGGNPFLRFDNSNDELLINDPGAIKSAVCVVRPITINNSERCILRLGNNGTGTNLYADFGASKWGTYVTPSARIADETLSTTVASLLTIQRTSTNNILRRDGVTKYDSAGSNPVDGGYNSIGRTHGYGQQYNGDVGLVALFSTNLTNSLRARLERSLALAFKISCS